MDASVRFKTSKLDAIRRQAATESRGILMFDHAGHSIFAATHETMYKYLPISKAASVAVSMMSANSIYIHCSKEVTDKHQANVLLPLLSNVVYCGHY
jgi:hypothetical protein